MISDNNICLNYYSNVLPNLPSDVNDQNRIVYLVYAIVLYAFGLFAWLVFITTKSRVVYSRQKSTFGMTVMVIGFMCAVTANVLREYIGRDNFNCVTLAWLYHIMILCFAPAPIGNMYYYIYKLRKERAKTQDIKKMFNEDVEAQSLSSFEASPSQLFTKQKDMTFSLFNEIIDFLFVWRHSKDGKIIVIGSNDGEKDYLGTDNKKSIDETAITPHHQQQQLPTSSSGNDLSNNHKKSIMGAIVEDVGIPLMMIIAFGFPYPVGIALRVYLDPVYHNSCLGCRLTYVDFIIRMTCGMIYLPLSIMAWYVMRNEDDPLQVFKTTKYSMMWSSIIITSWIANLVSSFLGFDDRAFLNALEMVGCCGVIYWYLLSGPVTAYFDSFKGSYRVNSESRSAVVSSATNTANRPFTAKNRPPPSVLDIDRILQEPKARNALLEHSVNEISSENVVFVFKLRAWKSIWEKEKPEKVSKIATQLFREYISKDSKNPINISYQIHSKLEKNMEPYLEPANANNGKNEKTQNMKLKPNKDIFDECERECVTMLEHDALPRFCQSTLFKTEIIESGILAKILRS